MRYSQSSAESAVRCAHAFQGEGLAARELGGGVRSAFHSTSAPGVYHYLYVYVCGCVLSCAQVKSQKSDFILCIRQS